MTATSGYRRPPEMLPEPGQYESPVKFGKGLKGIDMGKKYETKYDPNLGPGTYQAD